MPGPPVIEYHRLVARVMHLQSIMVAGVALLGAVACSGGDDSTTASTTAAPTTTATIASTAPTDFRDEAEAICAEVSSELGDIALPDGAAPVVAADALRSMVDANRDGVDQLRSVEIPSEYQEPFESWLDLVDETAKNLEVGSLALRAGDNDAFSQALRDADDASIRASAAAQELGLPGCAFSG
jgi:hypothetical protein